MQLKIAIMGTRGIPNRYGGYEQAASLLAPGLVERGHCVTVYNSHNHPYTGQNWNGVEIVHCYDPEKKIGTAGQFIYDLNCIRHARKRNYDVILALGYTSSSIWGWLYPRNTCIISNMDGLEWKRTKYNFVVRKFIRYAEKLAIRFSNHYIADSPVIKDYLFEKYGITAEYIPYGARLNSIHDKNCLLEYGLYPQSYYLVIARMEPENNIEMILDGYCKSASDYPFVVAGNTANDYGKKMLKKYRNKKAIRFIGGCYDQAMLENLRHYCNFYFHGHSVGGTNPSLLEAMASACPIVAHGNSFNRAVTNENALYFYNAADVALHINNNRADQAMITANLKKVKEKYNWPSIIEQYDSFIQQCSFKKILHPENATMQLTE